MEINFLCSETGEVCWNLKALQRCARRMTEQEIFFVEAHSDIDVQSAEIGCEGVVENVHGLGKVCLPYVEPALAVYQDCVLELPPIIRNLRDVRGFKLVKPDGSPWDMLFNQSKS